MTNLLDNELIRKYFRAEACIHVPLSGTCDGCIALRILCAMQEPIRKGESYLNFANQSDWILLRDCPQEQNSFHPWGLRLPSRFQPEKKECKETHTWEWMCRICGAPKPPSPPAKEAEKCDYSPPFINTHKAGCDFKCSNGSPDQDVEEKIKNIRQGLIGVPDAYHDMVKAPWRWIEIQLRALVALSQRSGG